MSIFRNYKVNFIKKCIMNNNRILFLAGSGIVIIIIVAFLLFPSGNQEEDSRRFHVHKGDLEMHVIVTGELESENSVEILGPRELQSRNIRLGDIPIIDMVSEGTQVEEGDWVATLDRTEAELSLRDLETSVLEEETDYNSTRLDTTITLRNLRDELINLEHSVEEKRLVLKQSSYETPATIRKAELDVERASLDFEQAKDNYVILQRSAAETMKEAEINLQRRQRRFQAMSELLDKFVITAPQPGMVIYHREWNGEKRIAGSTIDSRDLTVAVIPDLSTLVSRAYVSDLDINKITLGQRVRIRMDAFHERTYSGQIIEVSNVGQEMPNTDAKVFEILILVEQADNLLRPAMTTSNVIVTGVFEDVYYVPLAAVHEDNGISYVYRSDKTKQIVLTGASTDNFVIVEEGLEEGEIVYLSLPENPQDYKLVGQELMANARGDQ